MGIKAIYLELKTSIYIICFVCVKVVSLIIYINIWSFWNCQGDVVIDCMDIPSSLFVTFDFGTFLILGQ